MNPSDDDMPDDPTKPLEVVFAPGCFDNIDCSPEELAELVAAVHQVAQGGFAGMIAAGARQLTPEEVEELARMLPTPRPRQ